MRFLTPFAHERGVWFYGPVLLLGLLPGTLLLWPFLRFLGSTKGEIAAKRPAELGFLLLAGGWCLLFFTLSSCKLATYILPAFPPLALALGWFLAHSSCRELRGPGVVAVAAFALLAGFHHLAVPWYAAYRSPMHRPGKRCAAVPRRSVGTGRLLSAIAIPSPSTSAAMICTVIGVTPSINSANWCAKPRHLILCTHRHSREQLHQLLPPEVRIVEEVHVGLEELPGVPASLRKGLAALMGETALGLSDLAVVECKTHKHFTAQASKVGSPAGP